VPETLLCALKGCADGYFYIPTLGPFFNGEPGPPKSLKIELLFDNPKLAGDQTGGTSPYPELANYPDGKVDLKDYNWMQYQYGKNEGMVGWDYMSDVVPDRKCDLKDLNTVANNYGGVGSYSNDLSGVTVHFDTGETETPNGDGFVNIPDGATEFHVKKNGSPIGAMVTFWKEPLAPPSAAAKKMLGDGLTWVMM